MSCIVSLNQLTLVNLQIFFIALYINLIFYYLDTCGSVAQAFRRSPPTAGVPSSRLGHSMWVQSWTKQGLGRFFTGFLLFSPTTNVIPPFLHTHPFRFISSALVMVRQAGTLDTHGPIIQGLHRISSLDPILCWTRVEDIYLFLLHIACTFPLIANYNICQIKITVKNLLVNNFR